MPQFAKFLNEILKQTKSSLDFERSVGAANIFASYLLGEFYRHEDHWSIFQGWAVCASQIAGAAEPDRLARIADNLSRRLESHDVPASAAAGLVARHGAEATDVVDLGQHTDLLRLLAPDSDHLEAEIVWAARHELALSIDDFLVRRTRLGLERPDRAEDLAPRVAEVLGGELGWDVGRQVDELEAYLASAHRQFDVP